MISRKCIVTGKILPINQLIKFVLLKDKTIVLEKDKKIYGRGAYCTNDPKIIDDLFKKKYLNKSFKQNILPEIYNQLREEVDKYVKNNK